jgi:hypothetical protein
MWFYHPPPKLRKLRDSTTSRVGDLVIVVRVWVLVNASLAFKFYVTPCITVLLIFPNHVHLQLNHTPSISVIKILIEIKRNLV